MRPFVYSLIVSTKVSQMESLTIPFIHLYVLSCCCFANPVLSVALGGALSITRNSFSGFAMVRCIFVGLSICVLLSCHLEALGA
jgi:hypothetical protein